MKYSVILFALAGIFYIWRYFSAIIEHGLPSSPLYYISSIVGILVAYVCYRLTCKNINNKKILLIPLAVLAVSIVFGYSGVQILGLIRGGLFFWFMVSSWGFYIYFMLKKWFSKNDTTEEEQVVEGVSKGFILVVLILSGLFLFIILIFSAPFLLIG